jgi:predicted Zn-ribbon and HTH transcriptional regulator
MDSRYNCGREEFFEELLEKISQSDWHTGQSYEDKPAQQLRCKKCGGTTFEVAQGDYWTGVRCPTCKYEIQIHEG